MRDCDLYLGTAARDVERLARVYFGTPFDSFRRRIRTETTDQWIVPDSWEWKEGAPKRTLDLATGCWSDGGPPRLTRISHQVSSRGGGDGRLVGRAEGRAGEAYLNGTLSPGGPPIARSNAARRPDPSPQ